jgi:hypothetical protein
MTSAGSAARNSSADQVTARTTLPRSASGLDWLRRRRPGRKNRFAASVYDLKTPTALREGTEH